MAVCQDSLVPLVCHQLVECHLVECHLVECLVWALVWALVQELSKIHLPVWIQL